MVATNYILHLNNSFKRFTEDTRTTPFHLSLYMALFHKWNNAKFRNPLSVARDDLMYLSKIGSANTYIKCLKELDDWGYIKYSPSHSYHIGSKIYMYTFNTTKKTTINKTIHNATDISPNKTARKTSTQDVRPYKNTINITNSLNNLNSENDLKQKNNEEKNNGSESNSKTEQEEKEKSSAKKESNLSGRTKSRFERPLLQDVTNYFEQNNWQLLEAEKFHNYFESNGWLVGGKTPMKNWQAAAKNWILNSTKYNNGKNKQTPQQHHTAGKLHATTDKNFSEPL